MSNNGNSPDTPDSSINFGLVREGGAVSAICVQYEKSEELAKWLNDAGSEGEIVKFVSIKRSDYSVPGENDVSDDDIQAFNSLCEMMGIDSYRRAMEFIVARFFQA